MEAIKNTDKNPFIIVIPIFDGVDFMDIAAPREIFGWLNNDKTFEREVQIFYVGECKGTFKTNNKVSITIEATFDDEIVQCPNLIWVPGGSLDGLKSIINDNNSPYTAFVKRVGEGAEWVCSVCEGAILLANTGLLDHHEITTHWSFVNCFSRWEKVKVVDGNPRYVKCGNRVTGGGISSGLDEAIYLVELIAGKESAITVQQTMQYYPKPPVHSEIPEAPVCPLKELR